MAPNYQGREHNISFLTETRSPRCCLSQPGLSPCLSVPRGHCLPSVQFWHLHLGKGREGKASLGDTKSIIFPVKHMSHLRNAQPVSARGTGSRRSAHTLLKTASQNERLWLPGSSRPPPSFLPPSPLSTATSSARKDAAFQKAFFFGGRSGPAGFRKKTRGLSPPRPELDTALQAICVGSDAAERGFAPKELPLASAHKLCAGNTALLSTFPPPAVGMGTGTPEAHQDAQHHHSLRTISFPVLCAHRALCLLMKTV